MANFNKKDIQAEVTLGEKLRNVRQKNELTLEDVEKNTGIPTKYLDDLENSNYEKLPGEVYVKNFLKAYAQYLGLSIDQVMGFYSKEKELIERFEEKKLQKYLGKKPIGGSKFWTTPKIIRNLLVGLVIIIILLYLGLEFNKTISPPFLEIENPSSDVVTSEKTITIKGKAEKESRVEINGQEIFKNTEGNFSEEIYLEKGINIIKITAKKKRSQENIVYIKVLVEEEKQ